MQRGVVRRSNQVFTGFLRIPVELYHFCATEYLWRQSFLGQKGSFSGNIPNLSENYVLVLETESSKCWLRIPVEHCYQLGLCPCISHLLGSEGFNNRSSQTLEDRRGKAILNEGGDFLHIPSIRQSHVWAHVNFEIKHSSMNSNEIKTGKNL